jgi:preprotein translocase subunit SecF
VMSLKFNLPVVAALLTTVGYSLNDTIVIFDRIRENLEGKKRDVDYIEVVNQSINKTLSRTILTSLTTLTVTLILLLVGGPGLAAFSFALCIGVIVGTYSSIYIASPALIHFHRRSLVRREEMMAVAAGSK